MRYLGFPRLRLLRSGPGVLLALAGLLGVGCGSTASEPTDKAEALDVLQTVLQAWQQGAKPESLREREPPIVVNDPAWIQGSRLVKFEIEANQTQPAGYNLGCPVKLWLNDKKKEPRRVKFTVATSPALVVTRDFGG